MLLYIMLTEGAEPARIGSGLSWRIARELPQVEWVETSRAIEGGRFRDVFRAPDLRTAERVALLVSVLGDAIARVFPMDPVAMAPVLES